MSAARVLRKQKVVTPRPSAYELVPLLQLGSLPPDERRARRQRRTRRIFENRIGFQRSDSF
jgi:hypothetical protein